MCKLEQKTRHSAKKVYREQKHNKYDTNLILGHLYDTQLLSQTMNLRSDVHLTRLHLLPGRLQLSVAKHNTCYNVNISLHVNTH